MNINNNMIELYADHNDKKQHKNFDVFFKLICELALGNVNAIL